MHSKPLPCLNSGFPPSIVTSRTPPKFFGLLALGLGVVAGPPATHASLPPASVEDSSSPTSTGTAEVLPAKSDMVIGPPGKGMPPIIVAPATGPGVPERIKAPPKPPRGPK